MVDDSEEGKIYLRELFEKVHYLLFTIMVLFICQVLLLLHLAADTVNTWRDMNREAQNPRDIEKWTQRYLHPVQRPWWDFSMSSAEPNNFFALLSLRREFIATRKTIPPFSVTDPAEHLPVHFDFAEYLSICLGDFLAHIIHLPPVTWGALWVLTAIFYGVYVWLSGDLLLVSLAWVVVGALNLWGVMMLDKKCHKILTMLLNPSDFPRPPMNVRSAAKAVVSSLRFLPHAIIRETTGKATPRAAAESSSCSERSNLLNRSESTAPENMPAWTTVIPRAPTGVFAWLGYQTLPNRHTALFWGGHIGPELHVFLLRLHMIVLSVYVALVLTVFAPLLLEAEGVGVASAYLLVSLSIVAWEFRFVLKDLITIMCQVSCCGMLRRNGSIDEVVRKQKTRRAMRALLMMSSIVEAAEGKLTKAVNGANYDDVLSHVSQDELNEIGNIFDMYDADGRCVECGVCYVIRYGVYGMTM